MAQKRYSYEKDVYGELLLQKTKHLFVALVHF